ncbi:phage baseplate assembly protein [Pseudomonas chlororaphis]|uniref:phage baseplate assembly protein domain-containing protein n=2 Tax=Pseudomonas chlororaphis TaxID=587753 RepID=UPI001B305707|nr:phage baseplate assembly protein [Pseudomonas chlororaphis]MBP5056336.1 phage baseplate assembly protein [Pseudomonas chlororaphis]MBP5143096.1 phage baseplate assembly protein [Pseudomonas chlororaphis]QTT98506.1 phage baseplate assembly protein [Pseudomonas chlororaphis]
MSTMARLMREQISRVMANIRQPFRAVAARNTHGKLIGVQMQGLSGETVAGEQFQNYGFSSAPLPGAEYIVIPVGGNSKHSVVVASEDGRYRLQLQDGEVSLYTDEGDYVHMKRGRVIELVTDELLFKVKNKVRFETPLVEITGDERVGGDIKSDGEITDRIRSMQGDRDIYNQHGHPTGNPPTPTQ